MLQYVLGFLAFIFGIIGLILVVTAFKTTDENIHNKKNQKRCIFIGFLGVFLLFFASNIIIYIYSLQPISERIIKESQHKSNNELPELT